VGVVVTAEQLRAAVAAAVASEEAKIRATRYHTNPGPLLAKVRAAQPWGDAKAAKAELEAQIAALLGPRARKLAMQRAAEAVDPLPAKLPVLPAYPAKIPVARPVGAPAR
jgi:glutaminyl-tRNA synthetase